MSFDPATSELTHAERHAYRALRRDVPVDATDEDRTIALLRQAGVFSPSLAGSVGVSPARDARRRRFVAMLGICAAGIAVVAGASELRHFTHPRTDARSITAEAAATPAGSARPRNAGQPNPGTVVSASYLVWY